MFIPFKKKIRAKLISFVRRIVHEETDEKLGEIFRRISEEENRSVDFRRKLEENLFGLKSELDSRSEALGNDIISKTDVLSKGIRSLNFGFRSQLQNEIRRTWENIGHLSRQGERKKVVYTCLTGDYDFLAPPEFVDSSFDYVCFTDSERLLSMGRWGAWQIRPLAFSELDDTRNQRWHKTHPHVLFPEHELSVYHDANITVRSGWIFDEIERRNAPLLIPAHFERDCIFDEIEAVREAKRDGEESLQKVRAFLQEKDFPRHYGLNETNLIARRHNEAGLIEIMEEWWNFIRDYSRRDQLSLSYVLWRHGIKPSDIALPNLRFLYRDFLFSLHRAPHSERAELPAYEFSPLPVHFNIDSCLPSPSDSSVSGWAFAGEGKPCRVLVSTVPRIYNDSPYGLVCSGAAGRGFEREVFISSAVSRPDVQQVFGLESDLVGFSVEADTLLMAFTIYLVDDAERKIYSADYVCPSI